MLLWSHLLQVIYGYQKLATCSMDATDLPPSSNNLGVMITLRMRLHCSIVRAGAREPDQEYEVLNEIVVDRGSNSFLTNIEAYINGNFITRVQVRQGFRALRKAQASCISCYR